MIEAHSGQTTGFDWLRVCLATTVVLTHTIRLATGELDLFRTGWSPLVTAIMPMFFALSGFLVSASLLRNPLPQFVALRVLRIFPALAVEVLLSAIVLGAIFTTLPLRAYFADPMFGRYLLNMIGVIHYTLPGVFGGAPVNLQLWTIPVELECYVLLTVIALARLVRRRWILLGLTCVACAVLTALNARYALVGEAHSQTGRVLVFSFLFGCMIYLFREKLIFHPAVFVASLIMSCALLAYPVMAYLSGPPVAYATVYIGLQRFRRIPFGDLSYGLFLFHYPVAQALVHLSGHRPVWPALFALTMLATGLFAAGSWTLIERPLLRRKPQVLAWIGQMTPPWLRGRALIHPAEASAIPSIGTMPT